jgi:hypothetical protein
MTTNDKTDTPNSDAGNAAAKTETTASAKANARKKQQQQHKNQKNAPATKKKNQQQVAKSTFGGIASGAMKGIVIAQGNGNLFDQFHVYLNGLAGSAAKDKAYGLDSAILELTPKVRSDFIKPKPNPNVHSTFSPVIENGTATGGNKLICFGLF